MKKLFIIALLFLTSFTYAQKVILDGAGFSESDAAEKAYLVTIDNTLRWMVYDEVNNQFEYYDGTNWVGIGGTPDLSNYVTLDGNETITGIKTHEADIILPNNDDSEITTVSSDGISFFYDGGVLSGTKNISFGQSSPVSANFTLPAFGGDLLTKALTDTYYVSKEGFLVTGTDAGGDLFIRIGSATEPNIIIDQSSPNAYFTGDWIFADGKFSLYNGTYDNSIRNTNTTSNAIYELPDKPLATYTLATTEDIVATPNYDIDELTGDTTITSAMNGQLLQYKGTDTIVATIPDNTTLGLTNEEAAGFNVSFYVPRGSDGRIKIAYSGDATGDYTVLTPSGNFSAPIAHVVQDSINKYTGFGNWDEYTYMPPSTYTELISGEAVAADNEANLLGSWFGGTPAIETTEVETGTYALTANTSTGSYLSTQKILTTAIGDRLVITFRAKVDVVGQQNISFTNLDTPISSSLPTLSTSWQTYTYEAEATTTNPRIVFTSTTSNSSSNTIYIDELSVKNYE